MTFVASAKSFKFKVYCFQIRPQNDYEYCNFSVKCCSFNNFTTPEELFAELCNLQKDCICNYVHIFMVCVDIFRRQRPERQTDFSWIPASEILRANLTPISQSLIFFPDLQLWSDGWSPRSFSALPVFRRGQHHLDHVLLMLADWNFPCAGGSFLGLKT